MGESAKQWSERPAFAGLDWARDHHDIVVVDRYGAIVEDFRIEETAEGWRTFKQRLAAYPGLLVALETRSGPAVEGLMAAGCCVFPINPKAAQRYRDRKVPSGTKTDRVDAWSLADALRLDGHCWQPLKPEDPLTVELRLLCRDEMALIEQRTALICQLRAALYEYYPTSLQAFDDWTMRASWAFIERFPNAQALVAAGKRNWEKFLHTHKLYHSDELYSQRLKLFAAADQHCGPPAVTKAKSLLAVTLAVQLRVLQDHLDGYRAKISELFTQHPDHDLFGSLPGVGEKIGPRLLTELGDDRTRFDSAEGLQCFAGTAPVSYQSGQICKARFRHACQKTLRYTVHLWANLSRAKCPWAEAYYRKKRQQGQSHACALRCLGQRWLKILWKMWQTRTRYDAELHQRNQVRHGSWVMDLLSQPTPGVASS